MPNYQRFSVAGATYFFTVVLADRSSDLLVRHIDRLRWSYESVRRRLPFQTLAICVLPEHLHAIWTLPENDAQFPMRWSLIKSGFSRGLTSGRRSPSKVAKREKGLWQRRYWEHMVRSDDELDRCVDYIHMNPVKHGIAGHVADWRHSSFHRYVARGILPANWGVDITDMAEVLGEVA